MGSCCAIEKMQILASKFIYPEDQENILEVLRPFKDAAIQLSFFKNFDFGQFNHRHIKEICKSLNIDVLTVHAPTIDVFDDEFLEVLGKIRNLYHVNVISIHPQRGDCISAMNKLREHAEVLEDLDVILAYENFPSSAGRRKWIHLPRDMHERFELPFLKLTFDTSHLDNPASCIEEFDAVCDKVVVVHLSDYNKGNQHQPLGTGCVPYEQFVRHLKDKEFSGFVVLEYMEEFEDKLVEGIKKLTV